MTVDEFFKIVQPVARERCRASPYGINDEFSGLSLSPAEEGGGWRVAFANGVSWGDTIEDAVQAAHDHYLRLPSRHDRLRPPMRIGEAPYRVAYDYRGRLSCP